MNTSRRSGVWNSQNSASVRPWVSRMTCLLAATASGALRAMRSASSIATSTAAPGSASRDTRPYSWACSAVMGSAVSAISIATP